MEEFLNELQELCQKHDITFKNLELHERKITFKKQSSNTTPFETTVFHREETWEETIKELDIRFVKKRKEKKK